MHPISFMWILDKPLLWTYCHVHRTYQFLLEAKEKIDIKKHASRKHWATMSNWNWRSEMVKCPGESCSSYAHKLLMNSSWISHETSTSTLCSLVHWMLLVDDYCFFSHMGIVTRPWVWHLFMNIEARCSQNLKSDSFMNCSWHGSSGFVFCS